MGLGSDFSALVGGLEHIASDMESLVSHAISSVEALGLGMSGTIAWLVKFLLEAGEDPVAAISTLSSRIRGLGGDPFSTLEEMATGIIAYGLTGFAQKKATEALAPLRATLSRSTAQSQAVASLHQTTLSTMQRKLNMLQTGGDLSGAAWQGMSVQAMNAAFGDISTTINGLSVPLDGNGPQARLNQFCEQVLADIIVAGEIIFVCEIIVTAILTVAGVFADGVGALVGLGAGVELMEATLELLLIFVAVDLAAWLLGSIAIYVENVLQQHYAMSKAKSTDGDGAAKPSKKACQTATKLLKQYDRLAQKYGVKLSPKEKARLDQKSNDGTITSNDLPATLRREFPGELQNLTLNEIEKRCKGV